MRNLVVFTALATLTVACASAPAPTPHICVKNPGAQCMANVTAGPGNYVSKDIREALVFGLAWCRYTSPKHECALAVHAASSGGYTYRLIGYGEEFHVKIQLIPGDMILAHTHVSKHGMLSCSPGDDVAAQKLPIPVFVQTREGRVMQCGGPNIQTSAW